MEPIGWPETVFIFSLALVLFGAKKLPEPGRTLGKAIADFQRVKGELVAAFDRLRKMLVAQTLYTVVVTAAAVPVPGR